MPEQCPEYPKCLDRRVVDAEWKGEVKITLIGMSKDISEIKTHVISNSGDIKKLYYKVGGTAVGLAILVNLIAKII
jgi:hypothetical protein